MKQYGFVGKGTGKLGASVFAISGGEQIVRQYNPVVSNPNTEAQIAQRAKLKLMSQLGAALAPAIGFRKQGLVSARNQFVSKNIGLVTYAGEKAEVSVTGLQLTPSNVAFPGLSVSAISQDTMPIALVSAAAADVKRVAYYVYAITTDNQLQYLASKIVTEAGSGRTFPTEFSGVSGDMVVYAYGIKDDNASATIKYEEYEASHTEETAALQVVELFRSGGYSLTASVAVTASTN